MSKKESWFPFWNVSSACWAIDFRVGNKRIRRRLPVHDRQLKKVAIDQARAAYAEALNEEIHGERKRKTYSFPEAARLYIANGGEERFLSRLVSYFGSKTQVDQIGPAEIAGAAKALYPDAKPETIRRQVKVPIKAVLNFAAGNRRERMPDTKRVRWLTPEEAERLLAAASNPADIGLRDPRLTTRQKIAFMLGSGAGPAETMSATVERWNVATREWWLDGTKTVFRARYVRLPERAVALIGELPSEGAAFLAPNGQPYVMRRNGGGQMAEAFNRVRIAADLGSDVVPYTLRHTWATWFYAQTRDWGSLLDQGGWNRGDTANRYRKIAPSDLGNRLLAHGWDFRQHPGPPVRFGELVSV